MRFIPRLQVLRDGLVIVMRWVLQLFRRKLIIAPDQVRDVSAGRLIVPDRQLRHFHWFKDHMRMAFGDDATWISDKASAVVFLVRLIPQP